MARSWIFAVVGMGACASEPDLVHDQCVGFAPPTCPDGTLAEPYEMFDTTSTDYCGSTADVSVNGSASVSQSGCGLTLRATGMGNVGCSWNPFPATAVITQASAIAILGGSASFGWEPGGLRIKKCFLEGADHTCATNGAGSVIAEAVWQRFTFGSGSGLQVSSDGVAWTELPIAGGGAPTSFSASAAGEGTLMPKTASVIFDGGIFVCR